MSFSFYKPRTQTLFEEWCRRIFRKELLLEDLQIFGRSGQRQDGVDLLGRTRSGDFVGIQCKLRNLPPSLLKETDIADDIAAARSFEPQLARFIIATTAERDTKIQKYVAQVSTDHPSLPVTICAWQDIEDILNSDLVLAVELYPEFFHTAGLRVPGVKTTTSAGVTVEAAVTGGHEEINQAVDSLRQGAPGAAVDRLEKLRRERWDELTARERYRLFVNLGLSYLAKGDDASAASLLLQAERLQPADDEAVAFTSLGHYVAGDHELAYKKTTGLCRTNPYLPVAQAVRISSAPEELSYEEVKNSVPESVRKNADVARALYVKATREGNLQEAEGVLRVVEGEAPIPLVAFHLGTVILHREMDASHMTGIGRIASDKGRVIEAKELLTSSIPKLVESLPEYPTVFYNRAQAHLLLGDWQSAYLDFKSAHEAAPQDSDFAVAYAAGALERGEPSTAVKVLEETFERDPRLKTRLLLAVALEQEGNEEARERQEQLLNEGLPGVGSLEPDLRIQYLFLVVHVLSRRSTLDRKRVEELVGYINDPFEASVVCASALIKIGERELASAQVDSALTYLNSVKEWVWRRELAVILEDLDRLGEALNLWLELYTPGIDGPETRHVLRCATDTEHDDVVLEVTEQLRAAGIFVPILLALEVDTLVEYNEFAAARAVLLDHLRRNPKDSTARVNLINIAVAANWPDIVREYAREIPSSLEVSSAELGYPIVGALGMLGQAGEAARYAYELTRRFPDSSLSHKALITSILGPRAGKLDLPWPTRVGVDCAVRYLDRSSSDSKWIIIEGGPNPQLSRNEYEPNHPLAMAMMDKAVDEEFPFPGSGFRERTGVIQSIKNKIVFRANESMELWAERFPDTWMLERFTIQKGDEPSTALREVVEVQKPLRQDGTRPSSIMSYVHFPCLDWR